MIVSVQSSSPNPPTDISANSAEKSGHNVQFDTYFLAFFNESALVSPECVLTRTFPLMLTFATFAGLIPRFSWMPCFTKPSYVKLSLQKSPMSTFAALEYFLNGTICILLIALIWHGVPTNASLLIFFCMPSLKASMFGE